MAAITDKLLELEATLESLVRESGDQIPDKGERNDIVSHMDYIIRLMGTMVSAETFAQVKEEQKKGYNGIYDRADTINKLLSSGEISGDVDLYPLTITENGIYSAGDGKGFSRVIAEVEGDHEQEDAYVEGTLTEYENPEVEIVGDGVFYGRSILTKVSLENCETIESYAFQNCFSLSEVSFPACTSIGSYAFQNCSSLSEVSFPACISIGYSAFANCYSLRGFYLNASSVTNLVSAINRTFYNYNSMTFYVPESMYQSYIQNAKWSLASSRFVSI